MDGREFLRIAQELAAGRTEAHWRAAAGRAYYALMLTARDQLERWGFMCPPRENVHTFVRLRFFTAANADLQLIGSRLERLGRLRNQADYQLTLARPFRSAAVSSQAIASAQGALARLDQIDGDPARRTVAIAAIKTAWP